MVDKYCQSGLNRRKFLCYAGASIGSLSLPMAGTASAQSERPGAEEIGIHDNIRKLIKNGSYEEAHELLEKNGIEYDANKRIKYSDNEDGVGTMAFYSNNTEVNNNSYHLSGDRYHSILSWDYVDGRPAIDGPGPKDGASLSVSDSLWEPMEVWTSHQDVSLHKRGAHGYIARVRDKLYAADSGFMEAEFKKLRGGRHKIFGTYAHSWAVGGVYTGGISFGLGAGPLSVSTSGTIDEWKLRSDAYL